MKFRICQLSLYEIEKLQCDSISIFIFEDARPLRGIAGIVDWRLNGMISKLLIEGMLKGKEKENFLVPIRPRMPIEKLFGFGLGRIAEFSIGRVEETVEEAFSVLAKASVHSTAMMLPGRGEDLCSLEDGIRLLKHLLKRRYDLDELIIADRFEDVEKDYDAITRGLDLG